MKIAIEGCAHGELENIYSTIKEIEEAESIKIDVLICCGDFQSSRNEDDLCCMAVPPKYRHICTFYKYYNGEKKAPILTIFIGGNHEASNYLQELPYGGWVAPNIFYMGYAGVINIAGIRIGGISGIYKGMDYLKGRFEQPPYNESTKRSVYHIRNLEVFRLKQLSQPMDIFLSHDWPTGIYNYGNVKQLLKRKPFFRDEIESNVLGSKPCEELLHHLKPNFWFSAHLHCKFAALVPHEDNTCTKFLALDKCLPRRNFLQIVEVEHDENKKIQVNYDLEWLTVLHLTNHLLSVKSSNTYMPGPGSHERYNFTPTDEEKDFVYQRLNDSLKVPKNFSPTVTGYKPENKIHSKQPKAKLNPQTVELCDLIGINDPIRLLSESVGLNLSLDTSFIDSTSYITDTDSSDSVSESKVGSDVSIQEKIKELKLPEPKYDILNSEVKTSNEGTLAESPQPVESSPATESGMNPNLTSEGENLTVGDTSQPKSSPKRSLDEITNEEVKNTELKGSKPSPKKFKRRNAEMYASETCNS